MKDALQPEYFHVALALHLAPFQSRLPQSRHKSAEGIPATIIKDVEELFIGTLRIGVGW